jgi:hypothetical protein
MVVSSVDRLKKFKSKTDGDISKRRVDSYKENQRWMFSNIIASQTEIESYVRTLKIGWQAHLYMIFAKQLYKYRTKHQFNILVEEAQNAYFTWYSRGLNVTYLDAIYTQYIGGELPYIWQPGWRTRREITITNANPALADYQALIELDATNFDFNKAQTNGQDIRFTDKHGLVSYPYWIATYSKVSQAAKIFVRLPLAATAVTEIFIYYNNPTASAGSSQTAVFGADLKCFWPCFGNTNELISAKNLTNSGATLTTDRSGRANAAYQGDGIAQYMYHADDVLFTPTAITVCGWFWLDSTESGTNATFFCKYRGGSGLRDFILSDYTSSKPRFAVWDNVTSDSCQSDHAITYNGWHFVAGTLSGGVLTFTLDGVTKSKNTALTLVHNGSRGLNFLKNDDTAVNWVKGKCSRMRLYHRALTPTELFNMYAPLDPLAVVGVEENH